MLVWIVVGIVVVALAGWLFAKSRASNRMAQRTQPTVAPKVPSLPPKASAPAPLAPPKPAVSDETVEIDETALLASESPPEVAVFSPAPLKPERSSVRPSWPAPAPGDDVDALRKGLKTTRGGFVARLASLFKGKPKLDRETLDEIEEVLLTADLGVKTTQKLLTKLESVSKKDGLDETAAWSVLRAEARELLNVAAPPFTFAKRPTVLLVVGVNGVGKTTTIGKLASRFMHEGRSVVLAAGDTFRAAAVLQLEVWGRKVGCPVVRGKEGADPGSVIFDAIKKAIADDVDIVIADTAGRLHTKAPLMEELSKVYRTIEKALDGRGPDEILLVLDSTNGQNAFQQAQLFKEALPVSSLVLTKLDGSAKGGVVLGVVAEHQIPVRYIGIGERVEDLRDFRAEAFVEALFTRPEDATSA